MLRLRWPDSTNPVSEEPGTVQGDSTGTAFAIDHASEQYLVLLKPDPAYDDWFTRCAENAPVLGVVGPDGAHAAALMQGPDRNGQGGFLSAPWVGSPHEKWSSLKHLSI